MWRTELASIPASAGSNRTKQLDCAGVLEGQLEEVCIAALTSKRDSRYRVFDMTWQRSYHVGGAAGGAIGGAIVGAVGGAVGGAVCTVGGVMQGVAGILSLNKEWIKEGLFHTGLGIGGITFGLPIGMFAGSDMGGDHRPWGIYTSDTINEKWKQQVAMFYVSKMDPAKLAAELVQPINSAVNKAEKGFDAAIKNYEQKVKLRQTLQKHLSAVQEMRQRLAEVETATAILARRVAAAAVAGGGAADNSTLATLLGVLRTKAVGMETWYTCGLESPCWALSAAFAELSWREVQGSHSNYRLATLDDEAAARNFVAGRLLCDVKSLFDASSMPRAAPGVGAGNGYVLSRVELIENEAVTRRFGMDIERILQRRTGVSGSGPWDKPVLDDGEKLGWLKRLRDSFLPSDIKNTEGETSARANIVLAWHGTTEAENDLENCTAHSICQLGLADLASREDRGFFGRGCYTTLQAWYAAGYATGVLSTSGANMPNSNDEFVLLLCVVVVGNAYVISRATDYQRSDGSTCDYNKFDFRYPDGQSDVGKDLEVGFDAHFAPISTSDKCEIPRGSQKPDADELVVKSESQVLPLCKVYFKVR
jgi:hypothetical protein